MPRTDEAEALGRLIMQAQDNYLQRQMNHYYHLYQQITVPDDNPIPLNDRIDRLIVQPPDINYRLSSRQYSANGSDITFAILMSAYGQITYGDREPDQLWAEAHTYIKLRDLIVTTPNFHHTLKPNGDISSLTFLNAVLHSHPSIPRGEIFLFNSRYPSYPEWSIRIINLAQ